MNKWIMKLTKDLLKFNKIDERRNKNKEKDKFMITSFKVFIFLLLLTISILFINKFSKN